MKVASPASVSRLIDVSHCLNLKNRSSAPPEPASAACIETSSSFGVDGWENDRESISHKGPMSAIVDAAGPGRVIDGPSAR